MAPLSLLDLPAEILSRIIEGLVDRHTPDHRAWLGLRQTSVFFKAEVERLFARDWLPKLELRCTVPILDPVIECHKGMTGSQCGFDMYFRFGGFDTEDGNYAAFEDHSCIRAFEDCRPEYRRMKEV